ncbi:hypothetical protein BKA82DRAFT_125716 [Pisolithus tinctorius]|uniref:Uncharacterized protein n=1 Tax=Pisolithus tinctorius Marx 270 TaxID=870435 RepID=A0A0C3KRL8_PISTI|nr:hypothetical protein BKA82DRAFT_125716 [Pisolithus tinctorius]KIO12202.1 hypothetical protein M404DRAFT_125716 [Pisolithus tinctorius Marx 270]
MQHHLHLLTKLFFDRVETLLSLLWSCDAVVSGSCVLHILLPANETPWLPGDLDIYVSCHQLSYLTMLLECEGYVIVHEHSMHTGPYGSSSICAIVSFSNFRQSIDVIVSSTAAAVSPIFEFHSTAVMNFITADNIFCAYPTLTLHLLSMVNAGPLYFEPFGFKTRCALKKYAGRGFALVACSDIHGESGLCRLMPRSITDQRGLWVNISKMQGVSLSVAELFDCLGFIDLIWVLGGYVCGAVYPFVHAQCFLIEDDSWVTPTCVLWARC